MGGESDNAHIINKYAGDVVQTCPVRPSRVIHSGLYSFTRLMYIAYIKTNFSLRVIRYLLALQRPHGLKYPKETSDSTAVSSEPSCGLVRASGEDRTTTTPVARLSEAFL